MAWRAVNYGPLRKNKVVKKALEEAHNFRNPVLLKSFWLSVSAGRIGYQVRRDPFGSFVARFYFESDLAQNGQFLFQQPQKIAVVDFRDLNDLFGKTIQMSADFRSGYDFQKLIENVKEEDYPERFYLDTSSVDDLKRRPVPMHVHETKDSPEFEEVRVIRDEAAEEYCHDHEKEFYQGCHNTFDLHAEDYDPNDPRYKLQTQKFQMLSELYDQEHYTCDDDTWLRLMNYCLLLVSDVNNEGIVDDLRVNFSLADLCLMGAHNSAKGGTKDTIHEKGMTKTSMNVVATGEALTLLKQCVEEGQMTIRPHTMNPKDETNKPGKKEKMFNMLDHPNQKLHYLFHGDFTDRFRAKIQYGFMMGISLVGGQIDEAMRLELGISLGKGRLSDKDLEQLEVIQSDFEGFEFNPDHHCHLALAAARTLRYCGGVCMTDGKPSDMLRVALASEFERKLLPDLRVGGLNNVYKTPCIQISGEPDTLVWNQLMHMLMCLTAQFEYNKKHDRFLAEDTPVFEASPKNGDDGLIPKTDYVEAVLDELITHKPVKFTVEKRGHLLSDIVDAQLHNDGISFCKMNFVLEDGLLTLQRTYENLYKVVKGNKSTYDPRANISSCINQTQNVYGNPRFYQLLKKKYDAMTKKFGKLSELGVHNTDFRDVTAVDAQLQIDYFPTEEEVKSMLYTRDTISIVNLYSSLHRQYAYNVPAAGVARF